MSEKITIKKNHMPYFILAGLIIFGFVIIPNLDEPKQAQAQVPEQASFEDRTAEIQKEKERLEKESKKLELEKQIKEKELEKLELEKAKTELDPKAIEAQPTTEQLSSSVVSAIPTRAMYATPDQTAHVQEYINKYFPTSPITADMIINQANKSKVPVGFILAVGHNESHMGTKGRAVQTMNPMNVGNVTAGDNKPTNCNQYSNCLNDWQAGLDAFTLLITRCYFNEGEEIRLQTWVDRDFRAVRCGLEGKRYMADINALSKYKERINNLKQLNITY